jgi:hypothetical protein
VLTPAAPAGVSSSTQAVRRLGASTLTAITTSVETVAATPALLNYGATERTVNASGTHPWIWVMRGSTGHQIWEHFWEQNSA